MIVALDFDGVLAFYDGWKGPLNFGQANPEGIKLADALNEAGFKIIVYTCRNNITMNMRNGVSNIEIETALIEWLVDHDLGYCELYIDAGKPFANVYVDDRAVGFPANEGPALEVFEKIVSLLAKIEGQDSVE